MKFPGASAKLLAAAMLIFAGSAAFGGPLSIKVARGWTAKRCRKIDCVFEAVAPHKYLSISRLPRRLTDKELYDFMGGHAQSPLVAALGPGVKMYFTEDPVAGIAGVFTMGHTSYSLHGFLLWEELRVTTDSIAGGPLKRLPPEMAAESGVEPLRPRIVLADRSGYNVLDRSSGSDRTAVWSDGHGREIRIYPINFDPGGLAPLAQVAEQVLTDKLAEMQSRGQDCGAPVRERHTLPNGWSVAVASNGCAGLSTAAIQAGRHYFTAIGNSVPPAVLTQVLGEAAIRDR